MVRRRTKVIKMAEPEPKRLAALHSLSNWGERCFVLWGRGQGMDTKHLRLVLLFCGMNYLYTNLIII